MLDSVDTIILEKALKQTNNNISKIQITSQELKQSSHNSWPSLVSSKYDWNSETDNTFELTYLTSPASSDNYLGEIEAKIVNSTEPLFLNPNRFMMIDPQHGILRSDRSETDQILWDYEINMDQKPQVIKKANTASLEYVQEVSVRYLRPPTPPEPGEIIIKEMASQKPPSPPPLIIRHIPTKPPTPEPLVIREKPPTPPKVDTTRKLIKVQAKRLPPPPRRVVFERMPQIPPKPQSILIERWLPYRRPKRRVVFLKSITSQVEKPRNIIVQWDTPRVDLKREFKYLGVVRADPNDYENQFGESLVPRSEMPHKLSEIQVPYEPPPTDLYSSSSEEELVGDVDALGLIDLDREGLSQYREFLTLKGIIEKNAQTQHRQSRSAAPKRRLSNTSLNLDELLNLAETIFLALTEKDNQGRISYAEAARIFNRLSFDLNTRMGDLDLYTFFSIVDKNKHGSLGLDEFRQAFINLWALYC